MRFQPECYDCALRMVRTTAGIIGLPADSLDSVLTQTRAYLDTIDPASPPPRIVPHVFGMLKATAGYGPGDVFDPYLDIKRQVTEKVHGYYNRLTQFVDASPNQLHAALKVAAAGNVIDFGIHDHAAMDIEAEIESISALTFSIFEADELAAHLSRASLLLYVGDNTGEIFFDKVLIASIKSLYPGIRIVFAVRSGPILNDVTVEDARVAGIHEKAEVMESGSVCPGTVLEQTTAQFRATFSSADVVISKGQGNFETLHELRDPKLFFILRVKCDCIVRETGSPLGSLLMMRDLGQGPHFAAPRRGALTK